MLRSDKGAADVAIVVVAYNPVVEEFLVNLKTYAGQCKCIIVDNTDDADLASKNLELIKDAVDCEFISLGRNCGIAQAQNIGLSFAFSQGYEYVVELDQDTRLPDGYVLALRHTYDQLSRVAAIAGVGPIAVNKVNGLPYHNRSVGVGSYKVEKTLSSGFMISKSAFNEIGNKLDSLFIDYVDWEWCWRAKSKGFDVYVDSNLSIMHMLGCGHINIYFAQSGVPSPIRHYYQFRNSLLLWECSHVPVVWKIKRVFVNFIKLALITLLYDQKALRIKYAITGLRHGFCGFSGSYEDASI